MFIPIARYLSISWEESLSNDEALATKNAMKSIANALDSCRNEAIFIAFEKQAFNFLSCVWVMVGNEMQNKIGRPSFIHVKHGENFLKVKHLLFQPLISP